jgi:type III secretion system FlhB-like substrate exporter
MNNLNHTFVAKGVEKVSAQHLDETEEITVHLFTKEELLDLLRRDEMKQPLMVAPLSRYIAENHLLS